MIYIVLREPTASGYTNRFAFSDGDDSETITCGGSTIATIPRSIISVGDMSNRADISQARGALAQGIEWDLELVDWDGTARRSAAMYTGAARFYGWSVAVARADAPTASPAWSMSKDHWEVLDMQATGTGVSLTIGERWANDGRLLAFGAGGTTVPLVVGTLPSWVQTQALSESTDIQLHAESPYHFGVPDGTQYSISTLKTKSSSKRTASGLYYFDFSGSDSERLNIASLASAGKLGIRGNALNETAISAFLPGYGIASVQVSSQFYNNESPENVSLYEISNPYPVACGASSINGFSSDGSRTVDLLGKQYISNNIASFSPVNQTENGFAAYTLIPCTVGYASARPLINGESYEGSTIDIVTDGSAVTPLGNPATYFKIGYSYTHPLGSIVFDRALRIAPEKESDTEGYSAFGVAVTARTYANILNYDGFNGLQVDIWTPFDSFVNSIRSTRRSVTFDRTPDARGAFPSNKIFSSFADINAQSGFQFSPVATTEAFNLEFYHDIRAVTVYGISYIKLGSAYALVTPGASPLDWLHATASTPSDATMAVIRGIPGALEFYELPDTSIDERGIVPSLPTYQPPFGECLDSSKSYAENAASLAQEFWGIYGWVNGRDDFWGNANHSAQGLGEVLQAPRLVWGRVEDIITEPVIEYAYVAGKATAKAYIANVDLPYDSSNASKFYGGWGTAPSGAADPEGTDYGYLIWQQCRLAYLSHRRKRGATYQCQGVTDPASIGRMWWEAKRNSRRRIEWLTLPMRGLQFSVRETTPNLWAGASVYIPAAMATATGYDVSSWDSVDGEYLIVTDRSYSLADGVGTYTVALPPVPVGKTVVRYVDTVNSALTRYVDTVNASLGKLIDTVGP